MMLCEVACGMLLSEGNTAIEKFKVLDDLAVPGRSVT